MDLRIALSIIVLTYIGIALGTWPALRANRTTLTLVGIARSWLRRRSTLRS